MHYRLAFAIVLLTAAPASPQEPGVELELGAGWFQFNPTRMPAGGGELWACLPGHPGSKGGVLGREYVRLPPRRVVPPQRTDPAIRQPPERSMVHGRLVPCVGFHLGTEDRLRGTSLVIGGKRLYLQ